MVEIMTTNRPGKYLDPHARQVMLRYILNPRKMPHNYHRGYGVDMLRPADSMDQVAEMFEKTTGVQLRHFILSFDPHKVKDLVLVNVIAASIAEHFSPKYQVVYAVHENTKNLHVHFVVNAVSFVDGTKYRGTKTEFYILMRDARRILKWFGLSGPRYVTCLSEDFDE